MIIQYILPDQEAEFEIMVSTPIIKHIWHDVPNNIVYVYTEQDYIDYMGVEE